MIAVKSGTMDYVTGNADAQPDQRLAVGYNPATLNGSERCPPGKLNPIPARRSHYDEENKNDFMQKNLP